MTKTLDILERGIRGLTMRKKQADVQASLLEAEAPPILPIVPVADVPLPSPQLTDGVITMTVSIEDLLRQRAELDAQIEKARTEKRDSAFSQIQQIIETAGISIRELHDYFPMRGGADKPAKAERASPPAKYRDPANPSNEWSGRGKPSRWLSAYLAQGRKLDEFLIK